MAQKLTKTAGRGISRRDHDGGEATRSAPVFVPVTDIYETADDVVVQAEMPGVGPDDVEITLEGRTLTIRGRNREHEHKGSQLLYAEYGDGGYERVFTLSEEIDRDQIKATQKNGLLILELPKAAQAKARKIEVKPAA